MQEVVANISKQSVMCPDSRKFVCPADAHWHFLNLGTAPGTNQIILARRREEQTHEETQAIRRMAKQLIQTTFVGSFPEIGSR